MGATFAVEGLGVGTAKTEFSRWGWAFREQPVPDYGIDAHVEPAHDGRLSGKLIALQIKAGPSYFTEALPGGWVYRGSDTHLLYWLGYSLPVVLLLHNPESGVTYWAHVSLDKVDFTGSRWKMVVPSAQVLSLKARGEFRALAESAPAASDDPVEQSCARLPPTTAEIVRNAEHFEPGGALRLAAWLASGRGTPRLTVESVLSAAPSWLPRGLGCFEAALATFAGEHGHPDLAAEAFTRAAGYSQQPAGVLLAYAALCAAEAGDSSRARMLISLTRNCPCPPLLLATAEAVVAHLGQLGPVPVPDVLAAAGPAERAAEPTCLSFLGAQALRRQDVNAAIRYFDEACSAHPDSTSARLQLAQALQSRIVSGNSAVEAEDLRRIEEAARGVLEQRRRWSGPSSPALAMLIRKQMLVGAFEAAARLAAPDPDGEALESEASADEVVILGTQAALTVGDRERAGEFALRAGSAHAKGVVAALLAEPGLPADEQAELWRAVITDEASMESRLMALHRLACLGVWPLPGLDELHDAGGIDDVHRDILGARAMAGRGEVTVALSVLRSHASASPIAAEMLVDILQDAGRFEEAREEAARGFDRFGETVLAHKRLNLLVLSDHPSEAAAEAVQLLARTDVAPELRLRMRRRLISHHAHNGDWSAVADQSRVALGEFPGLADLQWDLIAATCNQGRPDRAQELFEQFNPEIVTIPHAGLWMGLHMHNGFTSEDVSTALDLLDRWPDDAPFGAQVLTAFLGAAGRRAPGGAPILPGLDPPTLQRFQSKLMSYATDHPDGPIQPVSFDPHDLADMLRAQLAPQAERVEVIERFAREGRVSLGVLAAVLDRSYAQALIQRASGIILAVTPDPAAFTRELDAAQAALDSPVIIQSSALTVSTVLPDRWPQLRGAFTEVRLPYDAWADFQAARQELLRDPDSTFAIGYDQHREVLASHQLSTADHDYLTQRLAAIDSATCDLTLVATPGLGVFADYAPGGTDVALSALALAAETGTALWSDDIVIRGLAHEHGIPAFGTLALMQVLIDALRLPDTLREDALNLARGYIADMVLTPEELRSLAAENEHQPGPATAVLSRPLFWAVPEAAKEIFMELIDVVNTHAPDTLTTWFQAACTGLAARLPESEISEGTRSLAEAASRRIRADDDLRARFAHTAEVVAEGRRAAEPDAA